MRALIFTSGGPISARIISAWLAGGNSVSRLWIGQKIPRRQFHADRLLGIAAPSWSLTALARKHRIPIETNPKLSSAQAEAAVDRLNADVLISAMTLEIVPRSILSRFEGRAVNFHPALLPHYRGPDPRIGLVLDAKASLHGGVTLHCLSPEIDQGDIIGAREVAYEASDGFPGWDVKLARAASDLVNQELGSYLQGNLRPTRQTKIGSYRKLDEGEGMLSAEISAEKAKWLCDRLAGSGLLRLRMKGAEKKPYRVSTFMRKLGPRTEQAPRIGVFSIDFDASDARVRVMRHLPAAQALLYAWTIARTSFSRAS